MSIPNIENKTPLYKVIDRLNSVINTVNASDSGTIAIDLSNVTAKANANEQNIQTNVTSIATLDTKIDAVKQVYSYKSNTLENAINAIVDTDNDVEAIKLSVDADKVDFANVSVNLNFNSTSTDNVTAYVVVNDGTDLHNTSIYNEVVLNGTTVNKMSLNGTLDLTAFSGQPNISVYLKTTSTVPVTINKIGTYNGNASIVNNIETNYMDIIGY